MIKKLKTCLLTIKKPLKFHEQVENIHQKRSLIIWLSIRAKTYKTDRNSVSYIAQDSQTKKNKKQYIHDHSTDQNNKAGFGKI